MFPDRVRTDLYVWIKKTAAISSLALLCCNQVSLSMGLNVPIHDHIST